MIVINTNAKINIITKKNIKNTRLAIKQKLKFKLVLYINHN